MRIDFSTLFTKITQTNTTHVYICARVLKPLTVRCYSVGKRRCGRRTDIVIIISYHHYQWCRCSHRHRRRRHRRSKMKSMIFQRDAASCRLSTRERLSRLHIRSAFYHIIVCGCHRYTSSVCRQRRQPTPEYIRSEIWIFIKSPRNSRMEYFHLLFFYADCYLSVVFVSMFTSNCWGLLRNIKWTLCSSMAIQNGIIRIGGEKRKWKTITSLANWKGNSSIWCVATDNVRASAIAQSTRQINSNTK